MEREMREEEEEGGRELRRGEDQDKRNEENGEIE